MTTTHTPKDEAEIASIIADAAQRETSLEILGGGTRREVGAPISAPAALSVSQLSKITVFEPGALTLVAEAGAPLAEVEATLAQAGQRLAFEPCDWRGLMRSQGEPTLGGAVASNLSGPRRIQMGACRDSLIGVKFVDGTGQALSNGGRVMKNVTGYDLVKLLCGSYGTLGVLTELAFKTAPAPEAAASLQLAGLSDEVAIEALAAALGSPFEVSGAAHLPAGCAPDSGEAVTMVRIEGFAESIRYRAPELARILTKFGDAEIIEDPARVAQSWAQVRDVAPFAQAEGAVWRLSVKPSDGPKVAALLAGKLPAKVFYDWGGGLIWALVEDTGDAGAEQVRSSVASFGGHATLIRAAKQTRAAVPVFQPEPPRLAQISDALRQRFDPKGVLNPGRMGPRDMSA